MEGGGWREKRGRRRVFLFGISGGLFSFWTSGLHLLLSCLLQVSSVGRMKIEIFVVSVSEDVDLKYLHT